MTHTQKLYCGVAVLLVLGMYFGLETKPGEQKLIEKSRALSFESLDINGLIRNAKVKVDPVKQEYLSSLESLAATAKEDSVKMQVWEQLSGEWYRLNQPVIAGHFAQKIAENLNTARSWAITGTTFASVLDSESDEKILDFTFQRAVQALENAISIDPENVEYRTNLAICYAKRPLPENPMKGIQMLLEQNRQHPKNISVLFHLANFGVQTGQIDKAAERLAKALTLDPENQKVNCLASKVFMQVGKEKEAEECLRKCEETNSVENDLN